MDEPIVQDEPVDGVVEAKPVIIDGGNVIIMMTVEGHGTIPVPVPAVFQQLFSILNHVDSRLKKIEEKMKIDPDGESRIVTLN